MALSVARRVNASAVVVKDSNAPDNEGYYLTNSEWGDVQELDGNYNEQIALAQQYDAANRSRLADDDEDAPAQPAEAPKATPATTPTPAGAGQQQAAPEVTRLPFAGGNASDAGPGR